MMIATLGTCIYVIVIYAMGMPVAGFTSTMLVLTGSFFGVFLLLAFIIKYLSILLDIVFKEHRYYIESIEKVTK
jgi:dolichol-phosphate mannosyltransferase